MKFKNTIVAVLASFLPVLNGLFAQVLMPSPADSRQIVSLNGTWKFKYYPSTEVGTDSSFYAPGFDVASWSDIKVPGNWELQGFAEPVYHKKLKEGAGLYRTKFSVPAAWKGNPVYLGFDGINFGYTVWINGKYAGEFASAYNRQIFDVSSFISTDKENVLAIKVITHPKGWEFDTHDDWSLSGISRNVTLFSLSPVHIEDVVVQTFVQGDNGSVSIKAIVGTVENVSFPADLQISGQLLNASGKPVSEFILQSPAASSNGIQTFTKQVQLQKPLLWSAETPNLYKLRLLLKGRGKQLQQYTENVGIRQVTWTGGILRVNGSPVKLKGATHHDLSPLHGRSITEAEMIKDLKLMQAANINFVRTSHYPPNARLLELCDSMGLYVDDEVPYGFGEEHLGDSSYLPILLLRAKATVWRDKNHPSIIFWSVGNENPVTEIGLKTGRYVKSLDNTRPYCFPQGPPDFREMMKSLPDSLDMLAPHYLNAKELLQNADTIDRPLVMTEYVHALGLDFNAMEETFEVMYTHPKLAGGAVWEFFDQGILRRSATPAIKGQPTMYAWASKDTMYDTGGNQGTDGVVYADRTPQVDYWQVRKVYTPVKALDDIFQYKPGKQVFNIKIVNRYDFLNLSSVVCKWQLFADTSLISSGILPLQCAPHDTVTAPLNAVLPPTQTAKYYYIKLLFENKARYQFYEKVYTVTGQGAKTLLAGIGGGKLSKPVKTGDQLVSDNYQFGLLKDSGQILLKNTNGDVLISGGPFARVGRKPSMAQDATTASKRSKVRHTLWNPFLLANPQTEVKTFGSNDVITHLQYKPDSLEQRSVSGDIKYHFSDSGFIQVSYTLTPAGKEDAVETGISFLIPNTMSEFRWVGKGPYEAYPGKDRLSEFGIFHLNSDDLYFAGNRQNVDCAVFSNKNGNGFALIADKANIAVERTPEGLVVSHNAYVSQRFNKYEWPEDLYSFGNEAAITGSFTIVPLTSQWPSLLKQLFGNPNNTVKAFQPFYHSYDQ